MKNISIVLLFGFVLLFSCKENQKSPIDNSERDSLMAIIDAKNKQIETNEYATTQMAAALDSISKYENILVSNAEGTPTKTSALKNLKRFQEILDVYRNRMTAIQDSLSKTQGVNKSLLTIIEQLNGQLLAKERQIATLRDELQSGKRELKTLRADLSAANKTNLGLAASNEMLTKVADTQDKIINKGYFLIDTKANLKKKGIIKGGGLLSKATINTSNIIAENFVSIDIRVTKEIVVSGKSPKILSQMPSGSYHWDGTTLIIDDPTSFWHVTNYLIIQVN